MSSLTEELKRSRVGIWKNIKSLEKEGFIKLTPIKLIKKKVYIVNLNWDNILVEKSLGVYLMNEAQNYEEWNKNFINLGNVLEFLILSKEEDSDKIIGVTQKGKFVRIQKPTDLQEKNNKEITTLSVTNLEFMQGIKGKNEEFLKSVKNGVILFGQENFIQFIKQIQNSLIK